MQVTAAVVTYNRLALLQECIDAIRRQTYKPDGLVVINNSSTDGTLEWLATQPDIRIVTQPNGGASPGFIRGLQEGYAAGADWVWLMDDDTIPEPGALAALVAAMEATEKSGESFGFFCSQVLWTDGAVHQRNLTKSNTGFRGKQPAQWYRQQGIEPVFTSTFVSLAISKEAIRRFGVPLRDFFIWYDDSEYTYRISKGGMPGGLVTASKVVHKTPDNIISNFFTDSAGNLWKYRYGIRNELYVRKHYRSYGSYVRNVVRRFVVWPFIIIAKRKDHRWLFIKTAWRAAWEALWFKPKREVV